MQSIAGVGVRSGRTVVVRQYREYSRKRRGAAAEGEMLESKTEELNFHRRGSVPISNPTLTSGAPLLLLTLRPLREVYTIQASTRMCVNARVHDRP